MITAGHSGTHSEEHASNRCRTRSKPTFQVPTNTKKVRQRYETRTPHPHTHTTSTSALTTPLHTHRSRASLWKVLPAACGLGVAPVQIAACLSITSLGLLAACPSHVTVFLAIEGLGGGAFSSMARLRKSVGCPLSKGVVRWAAAPVM